MYFWFNVKEFQLPKCIENNHDLSFVNFVSFLEFYFLRGVWSIDLNYLFLIYNLFYFSQFIKFWLCFSRVLTVLIVISEFALKTQWHDIWLWITAQKTYFFIKNFFIFCAVTSENYFCNQNSFRVLRLSWAEKSLSMILHMILVL